MQQGWLLVTLQRDIFEWISNGSKIQVSISIYIHELVGDTGSKGLHHIGRRAFVQDIHNAVGWRASGYNLAWCAW